MDLITSNAVKGFYKSAFAVESPTDFIGMVANVFESDQASETYPFITSAPPLREWVGGRNARGFKENGITVVNKHFETTLVIQKRDLRRDKLGVIRALVGDEVKRAQEHPADILSTLMVNGESYACYDGAYFFDTAHNEGDSGNQSNKISVDISALPSTNHGITTNPSVEEMQLAAGQGIQQIISLKDDHGKPKNSGAKGFIVMVPPSFNWVAMQAIATPSQVAASQTAMSEMKKRFSIEFIVNPWLSWTDRFVVIRTDTFIKPFIFQRETAINISAKAEGSDFEHDNDAHEYGVDYWGNVAYGLWHNACLVTLT